MLRVITGLLWVAVTATNAAVAPDFIQMNVLMGPDGSVSLRPRDASLPASDFASPAVVAHGRWNDTYARLGWSLLDVHANPDANDDAMAFGAGYFEGFATARRLEQHAVNTGVTTLPMSPKLRGFLDANRAWQDSMEALAGRSESATDRAFWHQSSLLRRQLRGVHAGYLDARAATGFANVTAEPLTLEHLLLINLDGDLEDLADLMTEPRGGGEDPNPGLNLGVAVPAAARWPQFRRGRCSALVRLLPDHSDVFISQDTWSDVNSMLRIFKLYDLPFTLSGAEGMGGPAEGKPEFRISPPRVPKFPHSRVPGARASFASYPGALFSGDDFYVLSSGLVVQETTIGNANDALNDEYVSPLTLMEWQRNVIANRLAARGRDWCGVLQKYNSGTYNNQFMILDYSLFEPGAADLAPHTFHVCEQIPGHVRDNDLTFMLQRQGYFASYNTAFDPFIRAASGADEEEARKGPWFSYDETARARIFRRDAPKVRTLGDMQLLMRSCNFRHDPLSTQMDSCAYNGVKGCSPSYTSENCVATRGDLNPKDGVWGLPQFGQRNHVATDSKISTFSSYDERTLQAFVVSGPTDSGGQLPPFRWSTSPYADTPHLGMPDNMSAFPWVHVKWEE
jgi:hypothetical protein